MREGQIVLADLPVSGRGWKRRPALILRQLPGYGDYLVCGLSSQLHQLIPGFGEQLTPDSTNGLTITSVIRLEYLFVIADADIAGQIGRIDATIHRSLITRLTDHLTTLTP